MVFRDKGHATGRNIHKSDPLARAWHIGGITATVAVTLLMIWAVKHYGFNEHLLNSWLTMRWVTGLTGFAGVSAVMTYPARKSIYRRRAGALRYWLLAHVYLGILATAVLLIHGGRHGGGLLTLVLMLSF